MEDRPLSRMERRLMGLPLDDRTTKKKAQPEEDQAPGQQQDIPASDQRLGQIAATSIQSRPPIGSTGLLTGLQMPAYPRNQPRQVQRIQTSTGRTSYGSSPLIQSHVPIEEPDPMSIDTPSSPERFETPDPPIVKRQTTTSILSSSPIRAIQPRMPGSSPPSKVQDALSHLQKELTACRKVLSAPMKKASTPIIDPWIRSTPLDFDKGDNPIQVRMRHAFLKEMRSISLARELARIVDEYEAFGFKSSVYRHVRKEVDNPVRVANLINCVPHEMIVALIDGNVAWRYENDVEFRRICDLNNQLQKFPGQYVLQFARKPVLFQPEPNTQKTQSGRTFKDPHGGGWLTPREVMIVVDGAKKYLAGDVDLAMKVDNAFGDHTKHPIDHYQNKWFGKSPNARKNDPEGWQDPYRRFYGESNKKKGDDWVKAMEKWYICRIEDMIAVNPQDPLLDRPMKWGPLEIGYGVDVAKRAGEHDNFDYSNRLFVFQNCLVTALLDPEKKKFKTYKFMINRLPRPGSEAWQDANTSDVAMTLIAKSYWFVGGANPDYAAGGGVNKDKLALKEPLLQESFNQIYATDSFYRGNLKKDEEAVEVLQDNLESQKTIDEDEMNLRDDWDEEMKSVNRTQAKLDLLKAVNQIKDARERIKYMRAMKEKLEATEQDEDH